MMVGARPIVTPTYVYTHTCVRASLQLGMFKTGLNDGWGSANKSPHMSTHTCMQLGTFNTGLSDGWGLANDGTHLLVTDSTDTIFFLEPGSFQMVRKLQVTNAGKPLPWINEVR